MNYLFRPTPVVTLGCDQAKDNVALTKCPAGMMYGFAEPDHSPSRSRGMAGDPWIVRSGSMSGFMLGQDQGVDAFSGDILPFSPVDTGGGAFDPGSLDYLLSVGATSAPIVPQFTPVSVTPPMLESPVAPPISFAPGTAAPIPPSGPGPTGHSIPATQPLTPVVSAGASLANALSKLFAPSNPQPPNYTSLAARGVNPNIPAPSWLAQSTVLPGTANATVLIGGAAVLVLIFALTGPKGK
jgi:hypothetical protein